MTTDPWKNPVDISSYDLPLFWLNITLNAMHPNDPSGSLPELKQQHERQRLLTQVALRIRESLDVDQILNATVVAVREILKCDRVWVYQFNPTGQGRIIAESVDPQQMSIVGAQIFSDSPQSLGERYKSTQALADVESISLSPECSELFNRFDIKAHLAIPIVRQREDPPTPKQLWGWLVANQCQQPRQWHELEIDFLEQLAVQIAIALQQAELYQQVKSELLQRQRMDKILQSSEAQYRRLFESNPNPMWVYDLETLSFLAVNQAAISLYGYSREEFLEMTLADLRSPDSREEASQTVSRVRDQLYSNTGVVQQRHKDGTLIDVELSSNAITWLGKPARVVLGQDVTQRLRSEIALRESERRYASLAAVSPVGIFRSDLAGNCTCVNQRALELLGISLEEAMGNGWARGLHPEDRRILAVWERSVRENFPFACEYRFVKPDGEVSWVFGQAVPERNAEGEIICYVGTLTDIGDRIRAENALQQLNQELEQRVQERTRELANTVDRLHQEIAERERAEREQQCQAERLQYLLASSSTIIYSCDADCQTTFVSDNSQTLLGYEPRQYIEDANFWSDRVHPEDLQRILAEKPGLFKTHSHICEYRFRHADGSYRWLRDQARLIHDPAGEILEIIGSTLDITDRKQAELALSHSEEQFRQLAETIHETFFLFSADLQSLIYISPCYQNIWGRSCQSLYDQPQSWFDSIHPGDRNRIIALFAQLDENQGEIDEEYRIVHPDGMVRWIALETAFVRDPAGVPYRLAGIAEDITQRKQAEAALSQSEALFQKMAANVPGMIYQYCLDPDERDEFTYVSSACEEIFEVKSEEVLQNSACLWSLIHPEDQLQMRETLQVSQESLEKFYYCGRIVTPSGRLKWIEAISRPEVQADGRVIWNGVLMDISDRKAAEAKLQEVTQLQQAILDGANSMIISTDADGFVQTFNKSAQRLLGYSLEEAIGKLTPQSFIEAQQLPHCLEMLSSLTQGVSSDREWSYRRKDGSSFPVDLSLTPLRDGKGNTIGAVGIASDISDRKQIEAQRQQLASVVKNSSDFIGIASLDGEAIYLNPAGQKLVGLDGIEAVQNTNILDYFPPEDRPTIQTQILSSILQRGHWEGEVHFRHLQTGQLIPVLWNIFVLKDPQTGQPLNLATVTRDITERKRAQRVLQVTKNRLEYLLSSSPTMIYSRKITGSYSITFISENISAIAGYRAEEFLSNPNFWDDLIHPEDREQAIAGLIEIGDRGYLCREYRLRHISGIYLWIRDEMKLMRDENNLPVEIVGSWSDISERKLAEQALQQSQDRYSSLVANIPGAVDRKLCLLDCWTMELIGEEIQAISGYPGADFILNHRRSYGSIIHPQDLPHVENLLAGVSTTDTAFEIEYRILHCDGNPRWICERGKVIFSENGDPLWVDGVLFDITARKQVEAKLARRDLYFNALVAAQRQLLTNPVDPDSYQKILNILGSLVQASRIYIFENHRNAQCQLFMSQKAEWCAENIAPQINNPRLQNLSYDEFFPRWVESLSQGKIIQGVVADFPESEREILEPQDIQAILILPLIIKGDFFGFIGFDNCQSRREWDALEIDLLNSIAGAIAVAKERQLIQEALERQLAAVEAATDAIAIVNEHDEFIYVNSAHLKLFEYDSPHLLLGKTWHELYNADECDRLNREVFSQLTTLGNWQGQATAKTFHNRTFAQEISFTRISGIGTICVGRDISERKQASDQIKASLKEKEILLKEIHHRVKNNLQIIQSLLRLQSNYTKDAHTLQMFRDSQNRIRSMALIHDLLYRSPQLSRIDFSEYIQNLTRILLRTYDVGTRSITIEVNAKPIELGIDTALPCGLILNEIISNSLKYAFPEGQGGKIFVGFSVDEEANFNLLVGDDGMGLPPNFDFRNTHSLGLQLICDCTKQLDGTIELVPTPGTQFIIRFKELNYNKRT